MARSEWIKSSVMGLLLTALMPDNRRVMQVALATGLRIGDVLGLRTEQLRKSQRPTIKEQKTGKTRRICIPDDLYKDLMLHAGRQYVFESRCDWRRARTRQAVYKDLRRVAKLYRLDGKPIVEHISPHSARKIWAVEQYQRTGSVKAVQQLMHHSDPSVTLLYALADELTRREHPERVDRNI